MKGKTRKMFIDKDTYAIVKGLIAAGYKREQISRTIGISTTTISKINITETYEEYRERTEMGWPTKKAEKKAEPEKMPEEKQEEKPAETRPDPAMGGYQMNRIIELLKEQNEMIKLISNKLAYIVCEFTGKGESDIT